MQLSFKLLLLLPTVSHAELFTMHMHVGLYSVAAYAIAESIDPVSWLPDRSMECKRGIYHKLSSMVPVNLLP